jgi:hypothetical protein
MSLYLPSLHTVFVHVPKTAGTWVKAAVVASDIPWEHARSPGSHNLPGAHDHPGARKFCFVRHPISWVESAWRGLHTSWPQQRAVAPLHAEQAWSPIHYLTYFAGASNFVEFIDTLLKEQPGFVSRMFEWYVGPPGAPQVDFVGRAEYAANDLAVIMRRLGWERELVLPPRKNESPHPPPAWPQDLFNRFVAAEAPAIKRWYGSRWYGSVDAPFEVTRD